MVQFKMPPKKRTSIEVICADNGCLIHILIGRKVLSSRVFFKIPVKFYIESWLEEVTEKYKKDEYKRNNPILKVN